MNSHDFDGDGICDEIDTCPGTEYYDEFGELQCLGAEYPIFLSLSQNYPNPFNPLTSIEFQIDINDNIQLTIYDIKGRQVKTLISGFVLAGSYITNWDGKDKHGFNVPSGIYIYKLLTSNRTLSKKMTLLR
tara:strand:- start:583 stop:975 length:393 start_codon:yes stop_codon:yes gene_type:complete